MHDLDYIDTNNVFANAVLNAKYQEAVERDILMVCKINDLSGLAMDSSDLVILLSNLLNNAVEACEKCPAEPSRESTVSVGLKPCPRKIKLKCVCEEGEFILSVRNTQNGALRKAREKLYSTKNDNPGSHGIGLKNVVQIVEKYGGYYAIGHTKSEFQISIIIPHMART